MNNDLPMTVHLTDLEVGDGLWLDGDSGEFAFTCLRPASMDSQGVFGVITRRESDGVAQIARLLGMIAFGGTMPGDIPPGLESDVVITEHGRLIIITYSETGDPTLETVLCSEVKIFKTASTT